MFYELETQELLCLVTPKDEHQGYPGRLHGGIATSLLDETIGRSLLIYYNEDVWGATVEFTTTFKKPFPLG
ncbi:MAG: PaaI family thioesterase [Bacteroidetes bacterium]|nr:PaaI family thioesterase [Bacteroidota bacterium]